MQNTSSAFSYHRKVFDQIERELGVKANSILSSHFLMFTRKDYVYLDVAQSIERQIRARPLAEQAALLAKLDAFKRLATGISGYMGDRQKLLMELSRPKVSETEIKRLLALLRAHLVKMEELIGALPAVVLPKIIG